MKSPITHTIAKLDGLVWIRQNESESLIVARVGAPYQISAEEWACPAELQGVDAQYPDIHGASSLQALSLALHLIHTRLTHLVQDGEQILFSDDRNTRLDLASLNAFFGGSIVGSDA